MGANANDETQEGDLHMDTHAQSGATRDAEAARAELLRLVFDGTYERVHADIRELLFDPIFDARSNLTLPEAGRLAYQRSRFLHGRLERPRQILQNPLRLFALAEWPSLLDVSTFSLLMVHYNLCFGTLVEHGSQRKDLSDYFEELDSLSCFGPYMATELGFGNNVAAMRTEAVYDHSREVFVLHTPDLPAQKYMSYSGFQDIPKIAVVMARLKVADKDWGVFPFIVRISDERGLCQGVHAAPCPEKPVQGLDNGLTLFDHVVIPRRNLLSGNMGEISEDGVFRPKIGNPRKRFLRAMARIQPGRLCVASAAVGAGRASVYVALRYAQRRLTNAPGRNDMPIIEYRSYQLPVFTALAKVYAMTFLLNRVKQEFLANPAEISTDLNNLISITKALSTWEMTDVVALCRERCGAQGMFSVNRIADYGSLLQGLVTAEGDNQVLLATAAGQILAQPSAEAAPSAPDPRDRSLGDVTWLIHLLHHREHQLFETTRKAINGSQEQSYFEAWNGAMNSGIAMARARGVRIALQSLLDAVHDAKIDEVREALRLAASLYGLSELQRDAGFYLAQGVLTAEQVLAIPATADALCAQLRPHVPMLIDGFALSAELLRAPIARDDYVAAFCEQAQVAPHSKA